MTTNDQPTIDFLILADRAEVVGGKLYVMGGGWNNLAIADFRQPIPVFMALGILIPYRLAGVEYPMRVRLECQDGTPISGDATSVIACRPEALTADGRPLWLVVAGMAAWTLPGPGAYRVVASIGDGLPKVAIFTATTAARAGCQA